MVPPLERQDPSRRGGVPDVDEIHEQGVGKAVVPPLRSFVRRLSLISSPGERPSPRESQKEKHKASKGKSDKASEHSKRNGMGERDGTSRFWICRDRRRDAQSL
mmetsp:Transcript_18975/g.38351  ORF Transcript_18975/g.38351 Transcript_18975/m.38351 type:complete len:104 (+) Transcript_18975:871-1182(+)